jgi:hypothetical protein
LGATSNSRAAVDAQGRADCQTGQYGYLDGPWNKDPKYQPANQGGKSIEEWENTSGGGSHVTYDSNIPGLMGPSYVGRRLGIDSLDDVP